MPYVPPWVKAADADAAREKGYNAGLRLKDLRQRAADSVRNHAARMASIGAQRAASSERTALASKAQADRSRLAGEELRLTESSLAQKGRMADEKTEFDREALQEKSRQFNERSPWSGPMALKGGGVVQYNTETGEKRTLEEAQAATGKTGISLNEDGSISLPDEAPSAAPALKGSPEQWEKIDRLTNPDKFRGQPPAGGAGQQLGRAPRNQMTMGTNTASGAQSLAAPAAPTAPKLVRYELKNGKLVKVEE